MEITGMATTIRTSLAVMHRRGAIRFKDLAHKLESENGSQPTHDTEVIELHRAYVSAAIVTSAAYLEAAINEFFDDCCKYRPSLGADEHYLSSIGAKKISQVASLWEGFIAIRRLSIFEKYNLALTVLGAESFDRCRAPCQDANSTVTFRNDLMHAEPSEEVIESSIEGIPAKPHDYETRFSKKFPENPLLFGQNPYFPQRFLSAGCANWCLQSVEVFLKEFCKRLGINPHWAPS